MPTNTAFKERSKKEIPQLFLYSPQQPLCSLFPLRRSFFFPSQAFHKAYLWTILNVAMGISPCSFSMSRLKTHMWLTPVLALKSYSECSQHTLHYSSLVTVSVWAYGGKDPESGGWRLGLAGKQPLCIVSPRSDMASRTLCCQLGNVGTNAHLTDFPED